MGAYTGQSAAFLAVELDKFASMNPLVGRSHIKLDLVDLEMTKHGTAKNLQPLFDDGFHVNLIEAESVAASGMYPDASLDFVFIDANHTYEAVKRDIDAWLPKMKPGGIISGHDYTVWGDFGVIQAVTEKFDRIEVWRGNKGLGDEQMKPHYWPVWCAVV
jgi:predicted O-methyltransferase YrrM